MSGATAIENLRSYRVFDMAIFDWATSLLAAFIVAKYVFKVDNFLAAALFLVAWIAFGVLVHWALGINTRFGYYLGVNDKNSEFP